MQQLKNDISERFVP